ncbi:MAG TPA: type II secretion system F family protein [Candidatus Baltobacteraceae bacterium]|nr:type II secretion system F family protein [Candidatus Baltobacteraceae bacterium]
MVTALAPYAIFVGVAGAIGLLILSFWQRITAPLGPMVEEYRLALERADIRVRSEELLLAILGGGAALWLAAVLLLRLDPIRGALTFPLALTFAAFAAKLEIARRSKRRLSAFGDQLELVLRLMASGMRAGLGLRQALVMVIDELDDPARMEFQRVVGQANIGVSIYDALDAMARRMPSDEALMMTRAIRVQSQTGGNLAKVLEHLATTIKERRRVFRKMRALTAEGRMTGWVIMLLPFVVGGLVMLFQHKMRDAILFTMVGHIVIVIVCILEFAGFMMLRRIMRFEV